MADLLAVLGGAREIIIARELTKVFESIHTCTLADALAWLEGDPNQQRGEFVLLVSGAPLSRRGGQRGGAAHPGNCCWRKCR